jgi:hypothetical protein
MDDYHAVVELVSSGIVEIGDDGRAYYRGNPVRNVTGEIVQAAHDAVDAQPDKAHMFTVHWSMEIYADDALQAAIIARDIQRDPNSVASEFTVTDDDGSVSIDLDRD